MAGETLVTVRKPQVQNASTGLFPHTCFNCKYEKANCKATRCLSCMEQHVPGDRFPLWEAED